MYARNIEEYVHLLTESTSSFMFVFIEAFW